MSTPPGSGMGRKSLGRALKALREQAGKSYEDVKPVGSRHKIWRIETGKDGPLKEPDIRTLCFMYGTDAATTEHLVGLAAKIQNDNVFEDYGDVLIPGFGVYLDLEAHATNINTYDSELVHGLLQIPEYHDAIAISDGNDDAAARRKVEDLRQERLRRTLLRDDPCHITAILGEGAFHRTIGSPQTMSDQLDHLREITARDVGIEVRVLPWSAGAHPSLRGGAFTVMQFDDPDPDVVYLESATDARYIEKGPKMSVYRHSWAILADASMPIEEYTR